jgi:hypothetical protein
MFIPAQNKICSIRVKLHELSNLAERYLKEITFEAKEIESEDYLKKPAYRKESS